MKSSPSWDLTPPHITVATSFNPFQAFSRLLWIHRSLPVCCLRWMNRGHTIQMPSRLPTLCPIRYREEYREEYRERVHYPRVVCACGMQHLLLMNWTHFSSTDVEHSSLFLCPPFLHISSSSPYIQSASRGRPGLNVYAPDAPTCCALWPCQVGEETHIMCKSVFEVVCYVCVCVCDVWCME